VNYSFNQSGNVIIVLNHIVLFRNTLNTCYVHIIGEELSRGRGLRREEEKTEGKEEKETKLNKLGDRMEGGGEEERIDNRRGEWAYKWVAGKKGGKGN